MTEVSERLRTILLIEDNENDEMLTIRAFRTGGILNEITVVRDGAQALEYLLGQGAQAVRERDVLPAVVLLDLNLPMVGGLEVLQKLRANNRTSLLPVVVVTSSRHEEDLMRSYALGANAYVRKPVAYREFVDAARALGVFWLQVNEPPPLPTGGN